MSQPHSIATAVQPFVNNGTLAGTVLLVANREKVLALEAVGYADIAARTPMRTDNLFWIASNSKPITATAFMMLVDEGRVNLDDPVEKYLPEFRGQMLAVEQDDDHVLLKKPQRPCTVRQILSHTSGLHFASKLQPRIDALSLREGGYVDGMSSLLTEPGTRYGYSNAGINTAGRILEVVSGQTFEDFLDQRLLQPLGMTNTTLWPTRSQLQGLAKSYQPNAAKTGLEETPIVHCTLPFEDRRRHPSPGGGYFSTAADLGLFARMILNRGVHQGQRLLSEAAVKEMTTRQTGSLSDQYGLGWMTEAGTLNHGHGGAYNNLLWVYPKEQVVLIYLVQSAGYLGPDGPKIYPAFHKAAMAAYAPR